MSFKAENLLQITGKFQLVLSVGVTLNFDVVLQGNF